MSATFLLFCAALLLMGAGIAVIVSQRAERKRGQAVGAFVDQHMSAAQAPRVRQTAAQALQAAPTPLGDQAGRTLWERPFARFPAVENLFLRAGVAKHSKWLATHGGIGLGLVLAALLFLGWFASLLMLLLACVAICFRLWWIINGRYKRMVRQLPVFLDLLIRQVTVGTSLGSALQQIAPKTATPLGEVLMRAAQLNRAGIELDAAVKQTARIYALEPLLMIGSVLGVSTRFGGRSDQVLDRIASFMRDHEQAQDELIALSAETRMSAWILSCLPLAIGSFLLMFNRTLFLGMWHDPIGGKMLLGAAGLQLFGTFLLYKLAKSV